MNQSQFTGGSVVIEDGTKPVQEYAPPRKVRVEIKFDIPEGTTVGADTLVIDRAAQYANYKVNQMLGRDPDYLNPLGETEKAEEPATIEQPAPEPTRRRRRTRAEIEADNAAAKTAAEDPASIGEVLSSASIQEANANGPQPDTKADIADVTSFAAPEVVNITDQELNAEAQAVLKAGVPQTKIVALIGTFRTVETGPFYLAMIPAGQRQDFLTKLRALKND